MALMALAPVLGIILGADGSWAVVRSPPFRVRVAPDSIKLATRSSMSVLVRARSRRSHAPLASGRRPSVDAYGLLPSCSRTCRPRAPVKPLAHTWHTSAESRCWTVSGYGERHRVPEGDERAARVQDQPVGPRSSETRLQRKRLPLAGGGLRMLAAPAVGGASGGASCAAQRGSTGVLAPSESPAGQVSTSLPLGPPNSRYQNPEAASIGAASVIRGPVRQLRLRRGSRRSARSDRADLSSVDEGRVDEGHAASMK